MSGLFTTAMPRVFSPPASADFLAETAAAILASIDAADPLALSRVLVLAPNRRAGIALGEAIAQACGGAALLPTIRPLADLDDDPDVWGPDPIGFNAPSVMPPLQRRLELARLVRARDSAEGGVADPVRALALADELCRLLDAASVVDHVDWPLLADLVQEKDLAAHWLRSAQFLRIITEYWPQRLAAERLMDAAARRTFMLQALSAAWRSSPPSGPVIIAGSTGSVAATRTLMAVAASLPQGAVVLPGLDFAADDTEWAAIGPQHPQHHLKLTLEALRLLRSQVIALARQPESDSARARRLFVREALAAAETTADWRERLIEAGGADLARQASQGLCVIEAETEDEEARVIAVLMREIYETPNATVALITPDASIARRVEAKLARFAITPTVTIGRPLVQTPIGVLISLVMRALQDDGDPLMLAALLVHPLCRLAPGNDETDARRALARDWLRGPRRHRSLHDLAQRAQPPALALVVSMQEALAPLAALGAQANLALGDVAEALIDTLERVGADSDGRDALWAGRDGVAASGLLSDLIAHGDALGACTPHEAVRLMDEMLQASTAPPSRDGDPRVEILGPLEARVLRRDLVILGGLNEGQWPAATQEDAFLSRSMRARLGLPAPEARLGLAAHDFAQAVNAPRVVLTRAQRINGEPSVASRWLWRLRTLALAAEAGPLFDPAVAATALARARLMDAPSSRLPVTPPSPRPPAQARLSRIRFTEVETLIRDPYAVYARNILGLTPLRWFNEAPDARDRGVAIHKALETFADGAEVAELGRLLVHELSKAGFDDARVRVELARLSGALGAYAAWMSARKAEGVRVHFETPGALTLECGVRLVGRADRIDLRPEGTADIIDVKTGATPTLPQVESGLCPQLTLEAAAMQRGAFAPLPAAAPAALVYVKLGDRQTPIRPLSLDAKAAADEALARLNGLLRAYADPKRAFLSKPRVQFLKGAYDDFDLLARRSEWADAEGEE